jgi:hypothetical protein
MARDVYTRRQEGVSIWVVPSHLITASNPDDKGELFDPAGRQDLPPPDLLRHPRRSGAHVMDARVNRRGLDYLLHLADNALVLGQRNAEWCGHAPSSKKTWPWPTRPRPDRPGAAALPAGRRAPERRRRAMRPSAWPAGPVTEDTLAYFRDDREFRNYTLLELPHNPAWCPPPAARATTPPPSCATFSTPR